MRALPPVAARRCGVFTSQEGAAAGWTRSALENAARHGRLAKLQRGVWADAAGALDLTPAATSDLLLTRQALAAALSARGGIVSHLAAARLHELPIWAPTPRPCVTLTHRDRAGLHHVHTHLAAVARGHALPGVVFTTVARTVVDVTREFGVEAGLVVADAALHDMRLHLPDLAAEVATTRPSPGSRQLADLLRLVDGRAESPLESRSRWHLDHHGVEPPQPQVVLRTAAGRVLGRVDFFWAEGVVGEVDGTVKYRRNSNTSLAETADERGREKWRQELMERTGLLFVRWGAKDLADFGAVVSLIADRRARAQRPGWPREWVATPS